MQQLLRRARRGAAPAIVIACAVAIAAGPAQAQYIAPPPDPGFSTSSTARRRARTRRSTSGSSPRHARSRAPSATQGQATLDPAEGSFLVGASPFGAYWYPVRPFGDAVFRIQYTVQNTPTSTRNGGIMIRTPEIRYTGADDRTPCSRRSRPASTTTSARARSPVCGLARRPAPSTTYTWAGADGPVPAAARSDVLRRLLRARPARHERDQPRRHRAADGQQQRQQPPALDAGLLRPRDPDQRDADRRRPAAVVRPDQDRLGLRLPQPQRQAVGHVQAPREGRLARHGDPHDRPAVHDPDRRRADQPVRQLDPEDRLAQRRPADDGAPARRRATSACRRTAATTASPTARSRSRRSRRADIPVNTAPPSVTGSGCSGKPLTCNQRHVGRPRRARTYCVTLVPLEQDRCRAPALPRAEPDRPGQLHDPGRRRSTASRP